MYEIIKVKNTLKVLGIPVGKNIGTVTKKAISLKNTKVKAIK
jgi:hypothetical protein